MKKHRNVLLLAATLLAAPALVSAQGGRGTMMDDEAGDRMGPGYMWGDQDQERMGYGHRGWGHHGKGRQGMGYMDPARFEQHLAQRMESLATPELKAQFIATQQARLAMMEQSQKLHRLMAEARANAMDNADLKAATLEKIAADDKLRQQKLKLMREAVDKLAK